MEIIDQKLIHPLMGKAEGVKGGFVINEIEGVVTQYFYKGVDNKLYHEVTNGYTTQEIDTLYLMRKFNNTLSNDDIKKLYNGGRVNDFRLYKGKINRLPDGCTECEYLECDGNQWIETNYIPQSGFGCDIKFSRTTDRNSWIEIFGLQDNFNGVDNVRIFLSADYTNPNTMTYAQSVRVHRLDIPEKYPIIGTIRHFKIINNKILYTANDEIIANFGIPDLNGNLSRTLPLFGEKRDSDTPMQKWVGRCYYCILYNGYTIIKDMRPILDSQGRPCMYDLVNKEFYYNQGTGEFLYKINDTKCIGEYLPESITPTVWRDTSGEGNHLIAETIPEIIYEKPYQEIIMGEGIPQIIPEIYGQTYLNTINDDIYISAGTTELSDWKLILKI